MNESKLKLVLTSVPKLVSWVLMSQFAWFVNDLKVRITSGVNNGVDK